VPVPGIEGETDGRLGLGVVDLVDAEPDRGDRRAATT